MQFQRRIFAIRGGSFNDKRPRKITVEGDEITFYFAEGKTHKFSCTEKCRIDGEHYCNSLLRVGFIEILKES